MILPDYRGGSIVNLMASISRGLGAPRVGIPEARLLPAHQIGRARHVVLLMLDGLGYEYLVSYRDALLRRYLLGELTSVFPSATAIAVTTFATGMTPRQHGVTGWHMYMEELDRVCTVLPFRDRVTRETIAEVDPDAVRVLEQPPLADLLDAEAHLVMPAEIADSTYNLATGGQAWRHGVSDLADYVDTVAGLIQSAEQRQYVYAYWPRLDSLAHQYGMASTEVQSHFAALDAAFDELRQELAGTDTLLLVTADHGLIDTAPDRVLEVAEHPDLLATLARPVCGEPRAAYCYLRPGAEDDFLAYLHGPLAGWCDVHTPNELVQGGWLGPGPAHPRLLSRLGDYALVMRDNRVIHQQMNGDDPFRLIGVHGGTSGAEMRVPLIAAACD